MNFVTNNAHHATRTLLGLMFFVFGLNGFLNFLPQPTPEGAAATFIGGLAAAPYFFPLLKGTEVLVGLSLLSNRFAPLALTVLTPITINIVAYNFALSPSGIGISVVIVFLQGFTMWSYRSAYSQILRAKSPEVGEAREARLATA